MKQIYCDKDYTLTCKTDKLPCKAWFASELTNTHNNNSDHEDIKSNYTLHEASLKPKPASTNYAEIVIAPRGIHRQRKWGG